MKILDIAQKDLLRAFRSTIAVGLMFIVPMLVTGLIYAAFGGMFTSSESQVPSLPQITIQVVNQDAGDAASGIKAGQMLVDMLTGDDLKHLFAVTAAGDPAAARAAVDGRNAAVALIIPPNFTQAVLSSRETAQVELYQDPALTFGPTLVREVVDQFLDGFSGGRIAAGVMDEALAAKGLAANSGQAQAAYGAWMQSQQQQAGWLVPVSVRKPNQAKPETAGQGISAFLGPVMAGMLIFFVFFGAASMAQTILREQEEGTLARMFTTPTPMPAILGGKFLSIFLMLIVQSAVLLLASRLVFGIHWGNLLSLILLAAGLVLAAAGFGVFLISLIKTDRQAGPTIGGVLAITGMLGGLMTTGFPTVPAIMNMMNLVVPQGWALRGFRMVLAGAGPLEVLLPVGVMALFGVVLFALGARTFRSRFA